MIRVRFAPSPTGNLHIGSARTALYNFLFAKANNGSFIVRIEDTDIARSTKEFEESILNDLKWLGLDWDEGPIVEGDYAPYHQSKRLNLHKQKAQELLDKDLAYKCYCTPSELEAERKMALANSQMPRYSKKCANLSQEQKGEFENKGFKPSIRFKVPDETIVIYDVIHGKTVFEAGTIGDFVILRSDENPTFHLSVVVDDGEMKITHVIRGDDHLPNTPKHVMLFKALGYDIPKFAHHSLIRAKDGSKLSKRHGATAVYEYRKIGYLPVAIDNYLALLSFSPSKEILTKKELIKEFRIKGLSKSPAIFDVDKLNWLNGQHIRNLEPDALVQLCLPYLKEAGFVKEPVDLEKTANICHSVQDNLVTLSEISDYAQVYFTENQKLVYKVDEYIHDEISKKVFETAIDFLEKADISTEEEAKQFLSDVAAKLKPEGIKGKNIYMPLRVALTGQTTGPELYYLFSIFGKEKVVQRISKALSS